jgi:hypothetical protein
MPTIISIGVRLRLQTLFSLAIWPIQLQAQLTSSIKQLFGKGAAVLCQPGQQAVAYQSAGTLSMLRMRWHGRRESRDPR